MNYYPRNNFNNGFSGQTQQRQYKDMQGKAWRNMRATKPNSPAFTGKVQIAGVTYYVSIWLGAHPQRGDEISMKFTPKQDARRQQFQNGANYNTHDQTASLNGRSYGFAPSSQQQAPYNAGPQQGFNQPNYRPQQQAQPGNAGAAPPANGSADYGLEGYPDSEEDFPGF